MNSDEKERQKVREKKKKKKKERMNELKNRERITGKKKIKSCGCCSNNGSYCVCLITEIPSKTKLWKLKIFIICFQFP